MRSIQRRPQCWIAIGLAACLLASGCATSDPHKQPPETPAPGQWYAPLPHGGADAVLSQWWEQFQDPVLSQLIVAAEAGSPSLAQAWAAIERARATLDSARSGELPSLNAAASSSRARQQSLDASLVTSTSRSASLDASWEVDLFGKLRHGTHAAQARLGARTDDWHDARVSVAAEVADTYVQYRACQLLAQTYAQEAASHEATSRATLSSVRTGFTAPADGALALANLASTRSSLLAQQAQCDLLVKSLVALTGVAEPDLRKLLGTDAQELPQPIGFTVRAVPAQALQQRPDIASLEREAAAAGAEVGAARADLYPSLTLSGNISVSASNLASSATTWSFGPALSLPLFDGGRRRAAVASAIATYEEALASWHQGVRSAVKEVEQTLVNLDAAQKRTEQARTAAQQYRTHLAAIDVNWRTGRTSLLTLEEARRSALSAQLQYLGLQRDRLQYWIALYKALGGGWEAGQPAVAPHASAMPQPHSNAGVP